MRVAFVGNVDHGKSTLIGRLLADSDQISKERVEKVQKYCDSTKQKYEYAYLLDALEEEQSQGITIDTTEKRFQHGDASFLFVDTPGHFEFLKKMIGGASRVNVAVFLLDVNEEISPVFLRQNRILDLLGIKDRIVLLNKMDLAGWSEGLFRKREMRILEILDGKNARILPVSAYLGENLFMPSRFLPWYKGSTFLEILEDLYRSKDKSAGHPRMTVQDAYRWNGKRIFAGRVESGMFRIKDKVRFLPSGEVSTIKSFESFDEVKSEAVAGDSIGFTLEDPIYLERGSVGFLSDSAPQAKEEVCVDVFWLKQQPLTAGAVLKVKNGTLSGTARVEKILYELTAQDLKENTSAENIQIFGRVLLKFQSPWIFDSFSDQPEIGRMVFFQDYQPVGGGIVTKIGKNPFEMDTPTALPQNHRSVIWLTGLSGSGKSTIAGLLKSALNQIHKVKIIDGDEIRKGLCSDLGYSDEDRRENVRRVAELAKLFLNEGYLVIVALISPMESHRKMAKSIIGNAFTEIFVDCPLSVCEERDVKGHYKKVRRGEITQFTGIQSSYEPPGNPDLVIKTHKVSESEAADSILKFLALRKSSITKEN